MSPSSVRKTFNKTSMLFVSTFSDTKKCQYTPDVSASVSSRDKSSHQQFASCQVKTALGTSVRCVQHCCGSLSRTRNSCATDRSTAIINGVFTHFYYPPSGSKSAAPSSQKAGTVITTQQCQPQPLSLPTLLNANTTVQWPGAHTNTPTVTLFILEKRMGT